MAVRPLLRQLELTLGDGHRVLAYLDDWYILLTTPGTLNKVYTLMDSQNTALQLNRDKCLEIALSDIAEHGLTTLGTRLGSPASQQSFLASKIDSLIESLNNLASLPHQDALLILRTCLQQDIRHLQRTMPTSPQINSQWARLDQALCNEVRRLRGRSHRPQGDRQSLEDALIALPIRLGGLGILSHQHIAPLALAAANDAADKQINALFGLEPNFATQDDLQPNAATLVNQELDFATHNNQEPNFAAQDNLQPNFATHINQDPPELATGLSQHERCEPMWQHQLQTIIPPLNDSERKLLAESASKLGRRWLNTIPFYQTLSLSNFEVSTALHYRLLAPSPLSICAWCSKSSSLGHDELCIARPRLTVARHDSVARIIHSALKTVDPTAKLEPHTFEGRRRNDIRLRGPVIGPIDFDIKVYTLLAADATKTTTIPPQGTSLTDHITQQSVKYLDRVDRHVTLNRPLTNGRFAPLVFSAGGLMAKGTRDQIQSWKSKLKPPVFLRMESFISLALIKARARSFDVGRVEREEDDD